MTARCQWLLAAGCLVLGLLELPSALATVLGSWAGPYAEVRAAAPHARPADTPCLAAAPTRSVPALVAADPAAGATWLAAARWRAPSRPAASAGPALARLASGGAASFAADAPPAVGVIDALSQIPAPALARASLAAPAQPAGAGRRPGL